MLTYDSTREPFGNPEAFLEAAHRPPASRPFGVAVTADGRYAYLANTGAGTV